MSWRQPAYQQDFMTHIALVAVVTDPRSQRKFEAHVIPVKGSISSRHQVIYAYKQGLARIEMTWKQLRSLVVDDCFLKLE